MGADASQLPAGYPTDGTQGHRRSSGAYAYGAFTLSGAAFQRTSASPPPGLLRGPYNTTSPEPFGPGGFSLPCAAFGRPPYSRHRFCFLFLRVLRCFNSPRSPSRLGVRQKPREVPFGHPPRFDGCLRLAGLIAACHALRRRPPEPSHPPGGLVATGRDVFWTSSPMHGPHRDPPCSGLRPFHPPEPCSGCAPLRGGPAGIRTRGLRLAKPTLSQAELPAH